ncbi:hypothetical protein M3Y96_01055100 [Aphelenchoides besseyi]|nr:hypothetical protein M3Y96_01055100 [Aphelenchoides besseyi]
MEANETATQTMIVETLDQTTKNVFPWVWCLFAPIFLFLLGLFVLLCWLELRELREARNLLPLLEDEATFHDAEIAIVQMENKQKEAAIEKPVHQQVR